MVWKVVKLILDYFSTSSIAFHKNLHGLPAGCVTGTASLEDKTLQKLAAMREEILYVIFLDLHKSYNALDKEIFLEILERYRMGPRAERIFWEYWDRLYMVACTGG